MTDYIERLRQSLPPELLELDQWVLWKFESRGGKQTKLPYNALTRGMASSTNPATWASFESAAAAYADVGYSGLGFVFSEHDPYTGVDLDHCITDGQMDPERREWLLDLDSYSEMSPSGTGVHVIVRARKPGDRCKNTGLGVEMYDGDRFFTFTGDRVNGTTKLIYGRQDVINALYREWFGDPEPEMSTGGAAAQPVALDDLALLTKIREKDIALASLLDGDTRGYPSDSEADLAAANRLAFWTGKDKPRMLGIIHGSKLNRHKWARADYANRTLDKAIADTRNVYTGHIFTNGNGSHATASNNAKVVAGQATPAEPEQLTDLGNGQRFARLHGHDVRHVQDWGWLVWNGRCWDPDKTGQVARLAKRTALGFFGDAANVLEQAKTATLAQQEAVQAEPHRRGGKTGRKSQ